MNDTRAPGPGENAQIAERLRGTVDAVQLFRTVPGIGPGLAERIHDELHLDTLEALEVAAHDGRLEAVAGVGPRRLNPEGKSWLPVLHAHRGGWHFTALYSNTAQAHRLGKVRDRVVIYFYDHDHAEGQHAVVTETRGPLAGRRVVRGREPECKASYAAAVP